MTQRTVTYNTDTHRIVPVEPTVEMTNRGAQYLTGLTSYAYPTADKVFGAMLAASTEYVSDETCANGTTPESEPTDRDLRIAEAVFNWFAESDKSFQFEQDDIYQIQSIIASVGGNTADPVHARRTDTELKRFATDVITAAGLLYHGKTDKRLSDRLVHGVSILREDCR